MVAQAVLSRTRRGHAHWHAVSEMNSDFILALRDPVSCCALALVMACQAMRTTAIVPPFQLLTDRTAYVSESSVTVTLRNDGDVRIEYNLCVSYLEGSDANGAWTTTRTYPDQGEICTQELRLLAPGESTEARRLLPKGLIPGTYRLRFTTVRSRQRSGALPRGALATNEFQVVQSG